MTTHPIKPPPAAGEAFSQRGKNTSVYLSDGSGCEKCNYTGNFGCWIAGRWHGYPQIRCTNCPTTKTKGARA
jgi:hypothetical protein